MRGEEPTRMRDRILFFLKTKGPQTATDLAARFGVTPMAVRHHLYDQCAQGLVAHTDEPRGVGRPTRLWRLTAEAEARFPDSHAELLLSFIQAARAAYGEGGIDRLLIERARAMKATFRARMPEAHAALADRVRALAELRAEEGYMAEWSHAEPGAFWLIENHCPICAAAEACQGLCRNELELFEAVLGPDVAVERTEHILTGARRCAYRIEKRAAPDAAPEGRSRTGTG